MLYYISSDLLIQGAMRHLKFESLQTTKITRFCCFLDSLPPLERTWPICSRASDRWNFCDSFGILRWFDAKLTKNSLLLFIIIILSDNERPVDEPTREPVYIVEKTTSSDDPTPPPQPPPLTKKGWSRENFSPPDFGDEGRGISGGLTLSLSRIIVRTFFQWQLSKSSR